MRLGPIKDQLLAGVPAFSRVSGAAAMAAAMQSGRFDHSAYVFISSINAGENQLANAVMQTVPIEVTVAYWVRNVSDSTGEAAMDDVEDLREAVVAALLGWKPEGQKAPLFYRRGEVISFSFGTVLWADRFVINTYLRRS